MRLWRTPASDWSRRRRVTAICSVDWKNWTKNCTQQTATTVVFRTIWRSSRNPTTTCKPSSTHSPEKITNSPVAYTS